MAEPRSDTPSKASPRSPVWSRQFIFLLAATFLAYANYSVFFLFYEYLTTLPIATEWFGLIIGVFSGVSLLVRPVVSPFFHSGNARKYLFIGNSLVIVTLLLYSLAGGLWSMLLIRVFHGLAFVVLGAAMMTLTLDLIPREQSGRIFGLISIVILIPNTVIPPLLPALGRLTGGFTETLALFALLTVLVFPLLAGIRSGAGTGAEAAHKRALTWPEIKADLRNPAVLLLLVSMFLFYCGHALIFFFLDPFGRHIGITATGFFLTLSTAGEIGVRVLAGSLFDRYPKAALVLGADLLLALGYALLAGASSTGLFFTVGVIMGLGWGVAMPLFNAMMFDLSEPRFRPFNVNLGMQMFQAGFFFGPFMGAVVVARLGFGWLFTLCAGLSVISGVLAFMTGRAVSRDKGRDA